jgi:hypothetical protein
MADNLMCPRCGANRPDDYTINNAGGSTTTFIQCKKCGQKGTQEAWTIQKNIMIEHGDSFKPKAFNLKTIKAYGIGDVTELASDKPSIENDPEHAHKRNMPKEKRRDNVKRLQDRRYDQEHIKASSGDTYKMAFNLRKLKAKKECDCFSDHGHTCEEDMCSDCKSKVEKTAQKPFNLMKIAREFRWT